MNREGREAMCDRDTVQVYQFYWYTLCRKRGGMCMGE